MGHWVMGQMGQQMWMGQVGQTRPTIRWGINVFKLKKIKEQMFTVFSL